MAGFTPSPPLAGERVGVRVALRFFVALVYIKSFRD